MNENDEKSGSRLQMLDARREQVQTWFDKGENDRLPLVSDEEMQVGLETMWRWFFEMRHDAVDYRSCLKRHCGMVDAQCNQLFDWRDGEVGALLVGRLNRLVAVQNALENLTALYDKTASEGAVRNWIKDRSQAPHDIEYSIESVLPVTRDFYRPILKMLRQIGNGGKAKSVLQLIREKIASQTADSDFLKLATPHLTSQEWRAIGYRAARRMAKAGFLVSESGEWAITPKGETFLEENE